MEDYSPETISLDPRVELYGKNLYAEIHGDLLARLGASAINGLIRLAILVIRKYRALPQLLPINNTPGHCLHIGAGAGGQFVGRLQQGWTVAAIDIDQGLMKWWDAYSPTTAFWRRNQER